MCIIYMFTFQIGFVVLTVVHVAVSFCRVQLNSSQVVFLCFCLLPLKEKGENIYIKIVFLYNFEFFGVFLSCHMLKVFVDPPL